MKLRFPPLSLATLLLLLALVSTLPLAGALLYSALEMRRATRAAALAGLATTLVRAADELRGALAKSRQLVTFLATDPTLAEGGPVACTERLGRLFTELAGYSNVYVLDRRGELVCSGRPAPLRLNLADREHLAGALEWERPRIGGPLPGLVYGRPVLPVAAALRDGAGTVRGAVAATVDLTATLAELRARHGSPGLALTLWRDDGTLLVREPGSPVEVLLSRAGPTLFPALERAAEIGGTVEAPDLDGVMRTHLATRLELDEQRLWLALSLATAPLYAEVDDVFRRGIVGAALVTILCILLAKLVCAAAVGRPLERIRRGIKELGEGRGPATLDACRGVKELRELVLEVEQLAARPPCRRPNCWQGAPDAAEGAGRPAAAPPASEAGR
ncbi:MAG: hypothetical protein K6T74_11915 [Geminicoccaceae bacterium]|nr:hypothetical protein [Geminicoccaceae bacterium]